MPGRTIAIGDIHGCAGALAVLIDAIRPLSCDTLITLGDYVDRGPDSCDVLNQLIALTTRCRLIPLLGDHEEVMLDAIREESALARWLKLGGTDTLRSYGWVRGGPRRALADWIPTPHQAFLAGCRAYYETQSHLFIHAGYVPELPMERQPGLALRWRVTDAQATVPHSSGKIAIVGHTRQLTGEILDSGFLICIDTNCVRGGWLTALDVESGQFWQANTAKKLRIDHLRSGAPTP